MKWDESHESPDVIDRRGEGGGGGGGGGLGWLLWILLRFKYGWVIVLLIVGFVAAERLMGSGASSTATETSHAIPASDTQARFVGFVLDDAQKFWADDFAAHGRTYRHAKLVLFTDRTPTACGLGSAATGPFYCPNDQRVYIDLGFFRVLEQKLGAHGDFARAYVVAHEIGHHIQNLEGALHQNAAARGATGASVRTELQADCYAGVWAHSANARGELDPGDIDSALDAASRIGDDVLEREETGVVRPESFTHGTAAQRRNWLARGYKTGDASQCDTFSANPL
ncbi:MAG TPA: neutral zinc metallopeptidase [Polyangiaceae bacterium]|jgi:hypothetical protein